MVPKHGMVMQCILVRGNLSASKALTVTSRARVESRPPESPTTACWLPVCSRRFLSPMAWMERISSQRRLRCLSSPGTKGAGSMKRRISLPDSFWPAACGVWAFALLPPAGYSSKSTIIYPPSFLASSAAGNVVMRLRSLSRRSMSRSAQMLSLVKRLDSTRQVPFSAMIFWPPNTRSWVDSPSPALAYT